MPCSIAVVGAGLVGCLQALYLSERGHHVVVFDKRGDLRKDDTLEGRSINLALSTRGRAALKRVGLEDAVLKAAVPVYGRTLHDVDGNTNTFPYGVLPDQHNYSIDRRTLNCILLDAIERKGVTIYFDHRLTTASFEDGDLTLTFTTGDDASEEITFEEFDFVFGCDGVYSALRGRVIESNCANLEIKHSEHGYRELVIPPTEEGKPALDLNHLHLWARSEFMLMALPNQDNSFTATLFMPMQNFNELNTNEKVTSFFETNFSDALPLFGGATGLLEQYKVSTKTKLGKLASVRLDPHHAAEGRVLLMGDAAHAMLPFYAQGMNCGFEDCHVLDEAIEDEMKRSNETTITKEVMRRAVLTYSKRRVVDAAAICDLAEYNYQEMRNFVNLWWFRWRKAFDHTLYRMLGPKGGWTPLYIAVSYTRTPYDECRRNKIWQDAVLRHARTGALLLAGATLAGVCCRPILKNVKWSH